MQLLIATKNQHKLAEIGAILAPVTDLELIGIGSLPEEPAEVIEDADTMEGNALKKARQLCDVSRLWTLADDSGLEVLCLGGAPGVNSARYAGKHGDDHANNLKLLQEMAGRSDRRARFRCVIALAAPDGRSWHLEGTCEGVIAESMSGHGGFGYDPLFIPDGYQHSFAELDAAVKNRISHRAVALRAALAAWSGVLSDAGNLPATMRP